MEQLNQTKSNVTANVIAHFAKASANVSAKHICAFFYHQPKMPDEVRKLNKITNE